MMLPAQAPLLNPQFAYNTTASGPRRPNYTTSPNFQPVFSQPIPTLAPPMNHLMISPPPDLRPSQSPQLQQEAGETKSLKGRQGLLIGAKNGFLFSLIAALPIWGVESYVNNATLKKTGELKGNLIQDLVILTEKARRSHDMVWSKALLKPIPTFLTSVAGTALIGISAGLALGPWIVGHAANRFEEVKKAQEEARQGLFQPKPPTLRQRLKLAQPPITDPNQAYQQLLDKELNSQHAFKEGAAAVLLFKMLPSLLPMAVILALCSVRNRSLGQKIPKDVWHVIDQLKLMDSLKLMLQPVFLVKIAALPIMGGFIAQQTVPWVRKQLGIDPTQVKISPNSIA